MRSATLLRICAEIDSILTDEGMTLPEVLAALTKSYNMNPAAVGPGPSSEDDGMYASRRLRVFTQYAERCQAAGYTYPGVVEALDFGGYRSQEGVREVRRDPGMEMITVKPLIWMKRA